MDADLTDGCTSPPSPDFSLDSSSPFANGLHFESILFEDEDEDEVVDSEMESQLERASCGSTKDHTTNTNLKTKLNVKSRNKISNAHSSLGQEAVFKEKSTSDCGLSSLVSRSAGIIMASSGSVPPSPTSSHYQYFRYLLILQSTVALALKNENM